MDCGIVNRRAEGRCPIQPIQSRPQCLLSVTKCEKIDSLGGVVGPISDLRVHYAAGHSEKNFVTGQPPARATLNVFRTLFVLVSINALPQAQSGDPVRVFAFRVAAIVVPVARGPRGLSQAPRSGPLAVCLGEPTYDDGTRPWLDNAWMRVYAHIVMVDPVFKKEAALWDNAIMEKRRGYKKGC